MRRSRIIRTYLETSGILPAILLLSVGCAFAEEPSSSRAAAPSGKEKGRPVIGTLKTRNETITIMSGSDGPLYTVTDKNGSVVFRELTPKELQARNPQIHRYIEGAIAIEYSLY